MASGSNAPFSGDFVDLENVPTLPEGVSTSQIFEQNSDVVRQVAEARHQAGLSQVNADGGFFHAYLDDSKIDNSTKIKQNTGTNGFVRLADGSKEADAGSLSNSNTSNGAGIIIQPKSDLNNLTATLASIVSGMNKIELIRFSDETVIETKTGEFSGGDSVKFTTNLSSGSKYAINVADTEVSFTGASEKKNDLPITSSAVDIVNGFYSAGNISATTINELYHIVSVSTIKGFEKSGTVVQSQFSFADTQGNNFSPSKVGIFPDQNLNGQSISYDLKDSSGNVVKTFNQSDLNQLLDVSTTDTTFRVEADLSGDGTSTPELEFLDVRGV